MIREIVKLLWLVRAKLFFALGMVLFLVAGLFIISGHQLLAQKTLILVFLIIFLAAIFYNLEAYRD